MICNKEERERKSTKKGSYYYAGTVTVDDDGGVFTGAGPALGVVLIVVVLVVVMAVVGMGVDGWFWQSSNISHNSFKLAIEFGIEAFCLPVSAAAASVAESFAFETNSVTASLWTIWTHIFGLFKNLTVYDRKIVINIINITSF